MSQSRTKKKQRFHPYARGFRAPNEAQRKLAIGDTTELEYQPVKELFSPIPKPSSQDDWLAHYNEGGQTFAQFMVQTPLLGKRKMKGIKGAFFSEENHIPRRYPGKSICILPIGDFPANVSPQLVHLKQYAEAFFCIDVKVLPAISLEVTPNRAVLSLDDMHREAGLRIPERKQEIMFRYHKKSGQYQLHATSLLQKLRNTVSEDAICTIAVTMSDLYESKSDLFLAGWAAGNARVACFSFRRYDPLTDFSTEYWHDIRPLKKKRTQNLYSVLLGRCCRLLVHEVAHMLGIDHCIFFACCMNGSGHLEEDFSQPMYLCPADLRKLQRLCGFDVVARYKKLLVFYKDHGMKEDEEWITARLAFLQKAAP
jgi:archaemetzincin